jgi:glyoxylase-like metal-dependent hydrolase (beta-lactamase superfamily II)
MYSSQEKMDSFPRLLAEGLWVLGNYYFNLYLVKGEQTSALIEMGVSAVVDQVIRQLESLRINLSFLVVTHPHTDHITGLPGLRERFRNAHVVAGEGASEFLAHPKSGPALVNEDHHMSEFLKSKGLKPGQPPLEGTPDLANCLIAKEGDEIDLGGRTLHFISVKGHSPGTIIAHIPEINALILSDSLGFRYPGRGVFPLFFTNYSDYMETIDRLEAFNPEIVGVAHQGPLIGPAVKKAFNEARLEAQELHDKIINDTRDTDEIIQEVFDQYYRDECIIHTQENIMSCAKMLVKKARESE